MALKTNQRVAKAQVAPAVVDTTLESLQAQLGETMPIETEAHTESQRLNQYVTFMVEGEAFAVEMAPVQEIIRVPEVYSVPLAPASLVGLANLRGKVLPIISLRHIFNMPEKPQDDATRAVVINAGQQALAFIVDRVTSVMDVEPAPIEAASDLGQTVDTHFLKGILKHVTGHAMVMVVNFSELIEREFAHLADVMQHNTLSVKEPSPVSSSFEAAASADELQLVSFQLAKQEYAICIEHVQEIVQMPAQIVQIPHTPAHVRGVMTLRQRLLPLVCLRSLFGLPAQAEDEQSRILVVTAGTQSVGLVTDSVSEVLRIATSQIDPLPGLLSRQSQLNDVTQICRLNQGQRLVSVISTERMFAHAAVQEVFNTMQAETHAVNLSAEVEVAQGALRDEEQVVIFTLNQQEYGVPIEAVQEIVRIPEVLTQVPKTPSFVEGVINLRGSVLPVIDQRTRLGLQRLDRNDHQRIMVFLLNGLRTGFIVDTVTEVLKIHASEVEAAPQLSGEQAQLISRVANLQKQQRMIQLINPDCLLGQPAMVALAAMHAVA